MKSFKITGYKVNDRDLDEHFRYRESIYKWVSNILLGVGAVMIAAIIWDTDLSSPSWMFQLWWIVVTIGCGAGLMHTAYGEAAKAAYPMAAAIRLAKAEPGQDDDQASTSSTRSDKS